MNIVQLSDTHIRPPVAGTPGTHDALRAAVAQVLRLPAPPDVVIVSGDLTDHGAAEEYVWFRELLAPLRSPVYVIPGNHDDRGRMQALFGAKGTHAMSEFMQYVVDAGPLRLIALDTVKPGSDAGELCAERLRWLDERLAEAPAKPTLIVMHHPPFATGLDVLDALGLSGAEAFGAIVARHPQIERVVAGHIHCTMQRRFHGTLAMTCTSTALQIRVDYAHPRTLRVTHETPSCLVHTWSERTGLLTHPSPIGDHGPFPLLHDGTGWVK